MRSGSSVRRAILAAGVLVLLSPAVHLQPVAAGPFDTFTISSPGRLAEGSGGGTTAFGFTITRTCPGDTCVDAATVRYSTTNGSAKAPGDFAAVTAGTVAFSEAQTSANATVQVSADTFAEPDETFSVTIAPASGSCSPCTATATITNDDGPVPTLGISEAKVVEGDTGTVTMRFPLTLSPASGQAVTVQVATSDGTARAPDDYEATTGTLTLPAGFTSGHVAVRVKGDTADELDEKFTISLSNPDNAAMPVDPETGKLTVAGTIEDDDPKSVLAVSDVTVTRSDGPRQARFVVSRSPAGTHPATVKYTTADGTATAGSDYTAASGTLTFGPGDASKTVVVTVNGESSPEPAETFFLRLFDASNALIGRAAGVATIEGDPRFVDQGYTLVGADGGIFNYGSSRFHGSTADLRLNQPVIGLAHTPGGGGYWLVARDGGIFNFGDAPFLGSMGDRKLNAPVLGIEGTPSGKGYYLFAADGGIFNFGDAPFLGSMGDRKLNQPVVGMATTSSGRGYWLVAQDGGIFTFGDGRFHGSAGEKKLNEPVFDMAAAAGDDGYWLVARDGGVFSFGPTASFFGSGVGSVSGKAVGIGASPAFDGYWIADSSGAVFPFGGARFLGDRSSTTDNAETVGFATVHHKR